MNSSPTANKGPLILFASQTGTAEDIAEKLLRHSYHFPGLPPSRLSACDAYAMEGLPREHCLLLVCSTAGQGDPPDNMRTFWRCLMRRALAGNCLQRVHFAVLGLGDSSYQKYNFVGKKAYRRLVQLGASPLLPLGLADDQHSLGVDGTLASWLPKLWTAVIEVYGVEVGRGGVRLPLTLARLDDWSTTPVPFKYGVEVLEETATNGREEEEGAVYPSNATMAMLTSNWRVTAEDHFQDTRHLVFSTDLAYQPGDVLFVQPENPDEDVSAFLNLIGLHPKCPVRLSEADANFPLPALPSASVTVDWLAKHYFDLRAVPRRSFFELTGLRSPHEMERERLLELAAAEGIEDLMDYCSRPRRSVLEVMQDFHETAGALPFAHWFDVLGCLKPRAFSIASSPSQHPGQIHLLVAVVRYKTQLVKPRLGLASNYLASLQASSSALASRVPVWVRSGTFTFPTTSVPVIMVGPGTGVAPFRSFIGERSTTSSGAGPVLFFGCRNEAKDFYFADEFIHLVSSSRLTLFTAFSRTDRVYVQQRIREQAPLLWSLLSSDAIFCVAGSAKAMPDGVRDAVIEVARQQGGLSEEEAETWLVRLEQTRRYQTETWS